MSTTVAETDRERLATAVAFYLDRCTWASEDDEKAEFERLLADLNGRSPRNLLVESLRDNGLEARWAETVVDLWAEYAGAPDAPVTDGRLQKDFIVYVAQCEAVDLMVARDLVNRLERALDRSAATTQEDQT